MRPGQPHRRLFRFRRREYGSPLAPDHFRIYNNPVELEYEWDDAKRQANLERHGLDFAAMEAFDWDGAVIFEDDRFDYGETRFVAYGRIHGRLVAVVYTLRGDAVRVISLRKANTREERRYGQS